MSNSIAPGSSADVNVRVTALTTNPNVPAQYKKIIFKKNLVNGVNTLTQAMISTQNTKYVIKYDYVLGEDITVPSGCILDFDGGSLSGAYTLTGTNTGIEAGLTKIFAANIIFTGIWNLAESYPEWFEDNSGYYDVAFLKAITLCRHIVFKYGKEYIFNSEYIDARNLSGRLHIDGNNAKLIGFRLAYDIKSDNTSHLSFGVDNFKNIIENVRFYTSISDTNIKPAFISASCFEIKNSTFSGYKRAIGVPPIYIDHISVNSVYMNYIELFLECYNYDMTISTNKFRMDWAYFANIHGAIEEGTYYFMKIGEGWSNTCLFENCLHLRFLATAAAAKTIGSRLLFNNCHWEQHFEGNNGLDPSQNNIVYSESNPLYLTGNVQLIFNNSFLYSSVIPKNNWLKNFVLNDCLIDLTVAYNHLDYDNLVNTTIRNLLVQDFSTLMKLDGPKFIEEIKEKIPGTITPQSSAYYYTGSGPNEAAAQNYTEGFTAKYSVALSIRKDELYNDGDTPTVYWSDDVVVAAGNCGKITLYMTWNHAAYMHVFKNVGGNIYRVVIPFTEINNLNPDDAFTIIDCNKGAIGVAWQEFTGNVEYVAQ